MLKLFDYIFYRVFKAYQKKDDAPAIYASAVLTVIQFFSLLTILAIVRLLVNFSIPQKYLVLPILVLLMGVNWFNYERDFDIKKLEQYWEHEDVNQKKRRGWLLVVTLIIVILFPILIGVLKNNLEIIS